VRSTWLNLRELLRVVGMLPFIEWDRHRKGPGPLVERLRARGRRAITRGPGERQRLRRLITAVDARLPGEPNCYRRSLLELTLDAGAAQEPLRLGLRVPGGPRSGHAWLGGGAPTERYDVQLDI
jgi:hypothetical protein